MLRRATAATIAAHLAGQKVTVPAPYDGEVCSGLRRMLRGGQLDERSARRLLGHAVRLPVTRVDLRPLLKEAFARRDRFGADEVFYAVLARRDVGVLLTCDRHLARAAEGYVEVRFIPPA